jgi:phenylacetate-CoA ligase
VVPMDKQIEVFAKGKFNSVAGVPSYLVFWLRRAVEMLEEGRIQPFGENFVGCGLGGEPCSKSLKAHIRSLALKLGAHKKFYVTETYGSTEFKWAGMECAEDVGIHMNPKFYFWELLDPVTRKPVKPGEPGVMVFSHIDWRGTAFIRYWTGDLVTGGYNNEPCPHCGLTFFRVHGPIARVDKDFTKIKGVKVGLQHLVTTIRDTEGVRNCQVVLGKRDGDTFGRDMITVRLLPEKGIDVDKVAQDVRSRVKFETEVTPDNIVYEDSADKFEAELFEKTGIKAEFVVDLRDSYKETVDTEPLVANASPA